MRVSGVCVSWVAKSRSQTHHVRADERRKQAGRQPARDEAAVQARSTGGSLPGWQAASVRWQRQSSAQFAEARTGSVCIGLESPVREQKARTSSREKVRSQVKVVPTASGGKGGEGAVEQDARAAACLRSGCSQGRSS